MANVITFDDGTDESHVMTVDGLRTISLQLGEGHVPLDGSVTTDKLADGSVTTDKLADNAVTTRKVADHAITDDKLSPTGVLLRVQQLRDDLDSLDVSIDPDDLGLVAEDVDDDYVMVYPTYRSVQSDNGVKLPKRGGGGGGGSSSDATFTATNTTGWTSTATVASVPVNVSVRWSSIEDGSDTGDGTLTVTANNAQVLVRNVSQGTVSLDVSPYLASGSNTLKVKVEDVYGNSKTFVFRVAVVSLSIASNFDASATIAAGATFDYTYIPTGTVEKTVRFEVDGTVVATETVSASGTQCTRTLPAMTHGSHVLRVWFTATVSGQTVTSNVLSYALVVVNPSSRVPIVACDFDRTEADQYETLQVKYRVYTPNSLTSQVALTANGSTVSTLTVDRSERTWAYRLDSSGSVTIGITSGTASWTQTLTVAASPIDVDPVADSLALHLTAQGRSNAESHPEVWEDEDNDVSCTLSGFSFDRDGWQLDDDGATVLRVSGAARVTVPYQPFAVDWRGTGKTVEIEFATHAVRDYDAAVISCISGGRGLTVTPQQLMVTSELAYIDTRFKEDEHVRVAVVCEKRTENRLFMLYVNGVMSACVRYPADDDFSQVTPVGITIGDDDVTTDIYSIRVYDNDLTRHQVLRNWIADSPSIDEMLARYSRNDVLDEYGQVVISKLPSYLPYMVISCAELPQYKGDKKTVEVQFTDPQSPSKSFTATGVQANVQGTSSAVYARKNYDLQFKQGFVMQGASSAVSTYQLDPSIKPNNRFVLKADVASSEGANNVELVKLFCDTDPYKRPEELADPLVRKGIWGRPAVLFWHDTVNNVTSFVGKVNVNLPKRAPVPYGYTGDMESWEFQNNTSDLMLFKTDVFDETPVIDPTTGEAKAAWLYDYEARFPEDTWDDYAKLQELQSFVVSCDPDKASDSTDRAARIARFREHFGDYAEVQSFVFYWVFTEMFLMVDSRAKNLFIGFSGSDADPTVCTAIDRKAVAEPYDMDTSLGIDNEGALSFSYNLEDTDHRAGGANVFNGQDSVLWNLVREAFSTEIQQTYQALRSGGTFDYATVEGRFDAHQAAWPEAVFNEDAQFKYIDPLVAPDAGKEPTDSYLPMLLGSKAEQRKWWLYNRFRYMDSRFNAGDALTDRIELRSYARAGSVSITPYNDIYVRFQLGSYTLQERGQAGVTTTMSTPSFSPNDTETYIYSASQLTSVGDLSGFKVGRADFSHATRLSEIKVGDSSSSYDNPNMTLLTVGANDMLQTLDARNCSGLAIQVDLSECPNVAYVYLDGTSVPSVALPTGGTLRTLRLPSSVSNLTVIGQPNITSFAMPAYSNITTLRIENCGTAIPYMQMLNVMPASSRVRIVGLSQTMTTTSQVEAFVDLLDTMRGLDESGGNVDAAQVQGVISGLDTVTSTWVANINHKYPMLEIQARVITHTTLTVRFYNDSTLLQTVTDIESGESATYTGTTPVHPTDSSYYTFDGWDPSPENVYEDTDCYATWRVRDEISDTWAQIAAASQDGTYSSKYHVGDLKSVEIDGTSYVFILTAMDTDMLASDTSQTAPMTWTMAKQLYGTQHSMSGTNSDSTTGGWAASGMRSWLRETVLPLLPSELRAAIKTVRKYSLEYVNSSSQTQTSDDNLWIPSVFEMYGGEGYEEGTDACYTDVYSSRDARTKYIGNSKTNYWLRTATDASRYALCDYLNNSHTSYYSHNSQGVCIGFCV